MNIFKTLFFRHLLWLFSLIVLIVVTSVVTIQKIEKSILQFEHVSDKFATSELTMYKITNMLKNIEVEIHKNRCLGLTDSIFLEKISQFKEAEYKELKINLLLLSKNWTKSDSALLVQTFALLENSLFARSYIPTASQQFDDTKLIKAEKNIETIINSLSTKIISDNKKQTKNILTFMWHIGGTLILFVSTLILHFIFIHITVFKPIKYLKNSIINFNLNSENVLVKIKTNDELEQLANSFNLLTIQLQHQQQKLIDANNELSDRSKKQQALIRISQIQTENQIRENEMKDKLLSIISHDLRSPFNMLMNMPLQIIRTYDDLSRNDVIERLTNMHLDAKQTFDLLENLLLWAKAQRRVLRASPEFVFLSELVNECIEFFEENCKEKNIQILNEVDNSHDLYVDKDILLTILRNLVSNALKFSPIGEIIRITAIADETTIKISIIDSGIGMTKDEVRKLFSTSENFTRKGTNDEKGSGMGFLICKEFVSILNGNIDVESIVNKGSTFNVTIPLESRQYQAEAGENLRSLSDVSNNNKSFIFLQFQMYEPRLNMIYNELNENFSYTSAKIFGKELIKIGKRLSINELTDLGNKLFSTTMEYDIQKVKELQTNYTQLMKQIHRELKIEN